jgi:hypothetical protein
MLIASKTLCHVEELSVVGVQIVCGWLAAVSHYLPAASGSESLARRATSNPNFTKTLTDSARRRRGTTNHNRKPSGSLDSPERAERHQNVPRQPAPPGGPAPADRSTSSTPHSSNDDNSQVRRCSVGHSHSLSSQPT